MTTPYAVLATHDIHQGMSVIQPEPLPLTAKLDTPAIEVLVDFKTHPPLTDAPDTKIDALNKVAALAIAHTILICNEKHHFLGLTSTRILQGDLPMRVSREHDIPRANLPARLLMIPEVNLHSVDYGVATSAKVGHIIETLHACQSPFLLVTSTNKKGTSLIRGFFSAWELAKQVGTPEVYTHLSSLTSLAELHNKLMR